MNLFTKIEGSAAITRHPVGILRQSELYARGTDVFIRHGTGFVRIVQKFGEEFVTTHPDIKVLEFEGQGVVITNGGKVQFTTPAVLKAVA